MNGRPNPAIDRAISCGIVVCIACLTLLLLMVILMSIDAR